MKTIKNIEVKINKIRKFIHRNRLKIGIMLLIPFLLLISFVQILDRTVKHRRKPIEYLVIHWTANTQPGADARANAMYLRRKERAGTHYCIDDEEIIQCTEEDNVAYAVGDRKWFGFVPKPWFVTANGDRKITNNNSLSFEMCLGGDRVDSVIIDQTARLLGWQLVNKGLDLSRVVRHHDVSGKHCPRFCYKDELWDQRREDSSFIRFKELVGKYQQMNLLRKEMWKRDGVWLDTILVGETTLKYRAE